MLFACCCPSKQWRTETEANLHQLNLMFPGPGATFYYVRTRRTYTLLVSLRRKIWRDVENVVRHRPYQSAGGATLRAGVVQSPSSLALDSLGVLPALSRFLCTIEKRWIFMMWFHFSLSLNVGKIKNKVKSNHPDQTNNLLPKSANR